MVCESVETMVVHSSCEKFCSKEEQKIEVTTPAGPEAEFHPGFPGCRWLSYRTG